MGKNVFHLHGVDAAGRTVLRKEVTRAKLPGFMAQLPRCLVGLEACGGSHHWGRTFRGYGHTVKMMAPQFVKPYVKSNKNDRADAEAICEAVQRPTMRFTPIKEVSQQELQSLHRVRRMQMSHRTALINQMRSLLHEFGIVAPRGAGKLRALIPELLEDAENGLTDLLRELLAERYEDLARLDERIEGYDAKLKRLCREDAMCRRLKTIPGIGEVGATALAAAVGDVGEFRNGREMAAWIGLVPKQHSTGGRSRLLGISKRGDVYLRTVLIHGARAALRVAPKKEDGRSRWVTSLAERRGKNIAAVALANKNVRTAWAMLSREEDYQRPEAMSAGCGRGTFTTLPQGRGGLSTEP